MHERDRTFDDDNMVGCKQKTLETGKVPKKPLNILYIQKLDI